MYVKVSCVTESANYRTHIETHVDEVCKYLEKRNRGEKPTKCCQNEFSYVTLKIHLLLSCDFFCIFLSLHF